MSHPHVLKLESVIENDDELCIVTEYCDKGDLDSHLKVNKKLS